MMRGSGYPKSEYEKQQSERAKWEALVPEIAFALSICDGSRELRKKATAIFKKQF